jgi:hypothetical protein
VSIERPASELSFETTSRLRHAFAARPLDHDALRSAVCAYVDEMKRLGAPIEQVLVHIKRIAEADIRPRETMGKRAPLDEPDRADPLRLAVTWSIEHYFPK